MTEESSTTTAQSLQRFTDSLGARIAWAVAKAAIASIVTGSIAMATGYVREMRDDIKAAAARTAALETDQRITSDRLDSLKRVSDATVISLQQIGSREGAAGFRHRADEERSSGRRLTREAPAMKYRFSIVVLALAVAGCATDKPAKPPVAKPETYPLRVDIAAPAVACPPPRVEAPGWKPYAQKLERLLGIDPPEDSP